MAAVPAISFLVGAAFAGAFAAPVWALEATAFGTVTTVGPEKAEHAQILFVRPHIPDLRGECVAIAEGDRPKLIPTSRLGGSGSPAGGECGFVDPVRKWTVETELLR